MDSENLTLADALIVITFFVSLLILPVILSNSDKEAIETCQKVTNYSHDRCIYELNR